MFKESGQHQEEDGHYHADGDHPALEIDELMHAMSVGLPMQKHIVLHQMHHLS